MFCGTQPSHWKWQKRQLLSFFLTRLRKKRLIQKRCARGKLVGVEEEICWKSYKLKVWHRFQNHNFMTYKEGRLTSNLGLQNVGSLTFCISEVIVTKKSKLKVWHSYRKNSLNHTSQTQKKRFFKFCILRSVSTCSLYLLQTLV